MPVVRLKVLLVVADGALVDQAVLSTSKVRGSVSRGEIERQATGLTRYHAFGVAWNIHCSQKLIHVDHIHSHEEH